MSIKLSPVFLLMSLIMTSSSYAATAKRWTAQDRVRPELAALVARFTQETGMALNAGDFTLDEDRSLAFNHYRRYSQLQGGVRVKGMGLRLWTTGRGHRLVQAEMEIESPAVPSPIVGRMLSQSNEFDNGLKDLTSILSANETLALAKTALAMDEDRQIRGVNWQDFMHRGQLVREVQITGRRGTHVLVFDITSRRLVESQYRPFDQFDKNTEVPDLNVTVYPLYEEFGGQIQPRIPVALKNLSSQIRRPVDDPFAAMRQTPFLYSKYDPIQALTPEGRALGFWSDAILRQQADQAISAVPLSANDFSSSDFLLQGKFTSVNIHPEAFVKFSGITIPARYTTNFFPIWKEVQVGGVDDYEVVPASAFFGRPLAAPQDAASRPASRDANHDPVRYINEGFDELQVYYAVNQMFDSLRPFGFTDPELSTRPFHAILYDPDIAMRDNAYYTNDTINFTTYSPNELNYARDNTTIWHELGHGIMERLMGDFLKLADTGGLSEGMADFVAALVVQDVSKGATFPGINDQRIVNRTGFFLTNEVHDDGEAYGGTMKDILDAAVAKWGQDGLNKMADLTLETMRLCRDNPHLTASEWFDHMLFADTLGRRLVRRPGELHDIITTALGTRNFFQHETDRGSLTLTYNGQPVDAGKPGSRGRDIRVTLDPAAQQAFPIVATVKDGAAFQFTYPVTLRVYLRTGPLQGAVHWLGEEQTFVEYTVNHSGEAIAIPLEVSGTCDSVNRDDGSCSDFAYIQIFNGGSPEKPFGKKRFYVRVAN